MTHDIVKGLKAAIRSVENGNIGRPIEPPTADEIRVFREEHGMSQEQFARHIDVSVETIRSWEIGRRRPGKTAQAKLKELA